MCLAGFHGWLRIRLNDAPVVDNSESAGTRVAAIVAKSRLKRSSRLPRSVPDANRSVITNSPWTTLPAKNDRLPAPGNRESTLQTLEIRQLLAGLGSTPPCISSKLPCISQFGREETGSQLTASSANQSRLCRACLVHRNTRDISAS